VSAVFHNPVYVLGFRNSLGVAIAHAAVALVGIPLSLLFQRWEFPGPLARRLDPLPLFVPPFVGALGIQRLLGPNGALNGRAAAAFGSASVRRRSTGCAGALLCGHSPDRAASFPVLYFNLSASLASQNPS